jgi:diguanylate cyclase (GGDEF)-like protein/PAS domain S-box-containing protein
MEEEKKALSPVIEYTIAGSLFGIIFPLAASIIEIQRSDLFLSFENLFLVQKNNPLLWIIDSAIVILGIAGFMTGSRQKKLEEQSRNLESTVEKRSQDLIHQKLFYEALVENNPIAIATLDKDHRIISINPAFSDMFGYRQDEVMGKQIDPLIANPERPNEAVSITKGVLEGQSMRQVGKRLCKDGTLIDVEIFGQPIEVNNQLIGVLGLYRNITIEKRAQVELAASEERFRRMFTDSPIALRVEDLSAIKRWMNEKESETEGNLCDYLNEHPEQLIGLLKLAIIIDLNDASLVLFKANDCADLQKNLHTLLSPESHSEAIDILCAMQRGETTFECEMIYQPLKGRKIHTIAKLSVIPGHEKDWSRVLFSNMDITDRKLAEERLRFISLHDLMTAVYNRAYFEEEMARLQKGRIFPVSVMVLDLDDLKLINDRYGHHAGDVALQTLADMLRNRFRAEDVVARIGGDEFAIILPGVNEEIAEKMRQRILEGLREHNQLELNEFKISVSIGCSTVEKGGMLEEGFRLADERMYLEKQTRKKVTPKN